MHVAKHVQDGDLILVLIDSDLLDTVHEEGKRQLDFRGKYYQGREEKEEDVRPLLAHTRIIHAAGQKTMDFMKKEGFPVEAAIKIKGIPFMQIVME